MKSLFCCTWFSSELTRELFRPRLSIWKTVLENDESSLSPLTEMIKTDYKANSTVAFMVLLSECEYDRGENMHECIRLQI